MEEPALISAEDILSVFFAAHDPTTINRQGGDVGEQYRSVIFYIDDSQKERIEKFVKSITGIYKDSIKTQIGKLERFYPAEEYHKDYFSKFPDKPYCQLVISPKVDSVKKEFKKFLKN